MTVTIQANTLQKELIIDFVLQTISNNMQKYAPGLLQLLFSVEIRNYLLHA